jgi:hypothetical protein
VKSNGKLKPEAYDPSPNTDEVSILRALWIGPDLTKKRSQALQTKEKVYKGLAVLEVGTVRTCGADVVDSRELFCGHGDIRHGIRLKCSQSDPPSPELVHQLHVRNKELAKLSRYIEDPDPSNHHWTGGDLDYRKPGSERNF